MFSTARRERLLADLLAHARVDPAVTAAALVGSAARGETDRWSDIDLALRLHPGAEPVATAVSWTQSLASVDAVADHLDLWAAPALYRVLLLTDSLQVDLSFWPDTTFASTGEPFALVFGEANPARAAAVTDPTEAAGWGWLYALHTRSALARGRCWQAVEMLDGLRGRVITLSCLRHRVPAEQGRGVDLLPAGYRRALEATLVGRPDPGVVTDAFRSAVELLLAEVEHLDPSLAGRLRAPLHLLTEPGTGA